MPPCFGWWSSPAAMAVEQGVAVRERRAEHVGFEASPGRLVDLAAGGNRASEIQRVAHQQLLVEAAAERMLAHPVHVAAGRHGQHADQEQARERRSHFRFASNSL